MDHGHLKMPSQLNEQKSTYAFLKRKISFSPIKIFVAFEVIHKKLTEVRIFYFSFSMLEGSQGNKHRDTGAPVRAGP